MLAILAPTATEAAGIRRALTGIPDAGAVLHIIGIGRERAIAGVARAAAARPPAMLMAGFCGAAAPGLRSGDLHLAAAFRRAGRPGQIAAGARLLSLLLPVAGAVAAGPSATVNAIAGPDAKKALYHADGLVSVNMEDYWAARAAAAAGIPFASIRAVLDTADETLPDYLAGAAERPARLALGLAAHPTRAAGLLRLARQAQVARRSLTRCVLAALAALAPLRALPPAVPQ